MNTTIIVLLSLMLLWLMWKHYIKTLEHGELKAKYSNIVRVNRQLVTKQAQPPDPLILDLCSSGAAIPSTPVPLPGKAGRPFVKYEAFTLHQAEKLSSTKQKQQVKCHACQRVAVIFTDFPLHGMASCPFCNATMTY